MPASSASPRPRRSRRRAAQDDVPTRERLLEAALEVFAERGFDGARTRDIAERAGANLGLLSYYFAGKEELWRAAVSRAFAEIQAELAVVLAGPAADERERLERVLRGFVHFVARRPAFMRLMNDEGKRDGPRMRWLADRHVRPLAAALRALVERAQADGVLPPISPVSIHYVALGAAGLVFSQAPECARVHGVDPTRAVFAEAHADALVALLLPPRRPRAPRGASRRGTRVAPAPGARRRSHDPPRPRPPEHRPGRRAGIPAPARAAGLVPAAADPAPARLPHAAGDRTRALHAARPAARGGRRRVQRPAGGAAGRLLRRERPRACARQATSRRRPTANRYTRSRSIAPTIAAIRPGPVSSGPYQPTARPSQPATIAPAMPSRIVTMMPPGSRPGMNSLASAPATRPIRIIQRNSMGASSVLESTTGAARPAPPRGRPLRVASGRRALPPRKLAQTTRMRVPGLPQEPGAARRSAARAARGGPVDSSCRSTPCAAAYLPGHVQPPDTGRPAGRAGRTLRDVLAPGLAVVFCGINPSLYSAAVGHHFARPGNRFWPALRDAGFTDRLLAPAEDRALLRYGCGVTNLVARATASADELAAEELAAGARRLATKVRRLRPCCVAFLGLGAYRQAFGRRTARIGPQDERLAGARVWVLPNPSGRTAAYQRADFARLFRRLRRESAG